MSGVQLRPLPYGPQEPFTIHDEFAQRAAVVEAGLRTQALLIGDVITPLASSIRALRQLNAAVVESKHKGLTAGPAVNKMGSLESYGFVKKTGPMQWPVAQAVARKLKLQLSDASTTCNDDTVGTVVAQNRLK